MTLTAPFPAFTGAFVPVDVISDTPEWEAERRGSLGASDVAAVLGLSPYDTAYDIYKAKKGIDKPFDPVLSLIGHMSEPIMAEWLEKHSGLDITLEPSGFMARSVEYPWLHASFDRYQKLPFITVQLKTSGHFAGHAWDEGIPTAIRVQVQVEMLVAGTDMAIVVVFIGGREFRHYFERRDDVFINDYLIPETKRFWEENVLADVPPPPSSPAEQQDLWPSTPKAEIEGSDLVIEAFERRNVLLSDAAAMEAEAEALKVVIGNYMQDNEVLLDRHGQRILTYKTQQGRLKFNDKAFRERYPHIHAKYMTRGEPFKVMRTVKPKKENTRG